MPRCAFLLLILTSLLAGCGPAPAPAPVVSQPAAPAVDLAQPAGRPNPARNRPANPPQQSAFWSAGNGAAHGATAKGAAGETPRPAPAQRPIDEARVAAAGIRKLSGKRLTLYTDLPSSPEVDRLCEAFDQAYPQWCEYFQAPAAEAPEWRMTGYLMKEKQRFEGAGLFPGDLPPFEFGYTLGREFWLYEQPSDYYRRHLLLHEGTHGFTLTRLGAHPPPWYFEGVAELLATHRWDGARLELNYFPRHKEEVPDWGRIKLLQEAFEQHKGRFLHQILDYSPEAHRHVEAYAWCWAAAAFLDGHPRYRERFREVREFIGQSDFADEFRSSYADDWGELNEEWQLYIASLDYGFDLRRSAIDFQPGQDLPAAGGAAEIAADRGWQSSRWRLNAGQTYRIKASGRYQVAETDQPWMSEPGGVSIRYYKGRPLGMLLAAMRADDRLPDGPSSLLRVAPVGLETVVTPVDTGTLYLRINDSPSELSDNAGTLNVTVEEVPR